jgi:hypothetical protein
VPAVLREMIGPQRSGLEQMGVGIDHGSWHATSVEKRQGR